MALRAVNPNPGTLWTNRGVSVQADASASGRKTGFRGDATMSADQNPNDPYALARKATDPRLASGDGTLTTKL